MLKMINSLFYEANKKKQDPIEEVAEEKKEASAENQQNVQIK